MTFLELQNFLRNMFFIVDVCLQLSASVSWADVLDVGIDLVITIEGLGYFPYSRHEGIYGE